MVSSLIDEDTRWWKVNIIHSLFLPSEAEAILRIPLSFTLPEDKLIWTRNKKATNSQECLLHSSKHGHHKHGRGMFLKHTWFQFVEKDMAPIIPPKVRIFAWCACLNALPTKLNLHQRGMNTSGFCPLCDKELELPPYALLHCSHAKHTWSCWHSCPKDPSAWSQDISDLALKLIDKGTP